MLPNYSDFTAAGVLTTSMHCDTPGLQPAHNLNRFSRCLEVLYENGSMQVGKFEGKGQPGGGRGKGGGGGWRVT